MDEAQAMKLYQPRDYLKQNTAQVSVVTVLSQISSKIHLISLQLKDSSVFVEKLISEENDMLAIILLCSVKDHIFIVELLCEHEVKLKVSISPIAKSNINIEFCFKRID